MIRVKPAIYCYQSEVSNEPKHHHETDETLRKHTTKTHKTYENTLKTRLRKFLDVPGALPAGGPVWVLFFIAVRNCSRNPPAQGAAGGGPENPTRTRCASDENPTRTRCARARPGHIFFYSRSPIFQKFSPAALMAGGGDPPQTPPRGRIYY